MRNLETDLQQKVIEKGIVCCPHCGSTSGFYTKDFVKGRVQWNYNFEGGDADNTERYDYLDVREGKVAYCQDCDKKIL